jgi:hypothetical protein
MKSRFAMASLAAFAAAGLWTAAPSEGKAQPFRGGAAATAAAGEAGDMLHQVRDRRYGHRYRYGHRHGWRHRDRGLGPALGGFAAGAIIGGALAQQGSDRHAYCSSKYRSYDPGSGTYLGYDGERHPCP